MPTHKFQYNMGKGDKKTKKGKIIISSFGVRRPKKQKNIEAGPQNIVEKKPAKKKKK